MASLATLVPINAKCKEQIVDTTTHGKPNTVNKLLEVLPDMPLGEMHFRVKVKSSNRISRKQVSNSRGKGAGGRGALPLFPENSTLVLPTPRTRALRM